jgi:hypothetical protein
MTTGRINQVTIISAVVPMHLETGKQWLFIATPREAAFSCHLMFSVQVSPGNHAFTVVWVFYCIVEAFLYNGYLTRCDKHICWHCRDFSILMSKTERGNKHLLLAFKFYSWINFANALGAFPKINSDGGVETEWLFLSSQTVRCSESLIIYLPKRYRYTTNHQCKILCHKYLDYSKLTHKWIQISSHFRMKK